MQTRITIEQLYSGSYAVFTSADKALAVVKDWPPNSYRINIDPKGTGRCFIEILDEETGEVLGKL